MALPNTPPANSKSCFSCPLFERFEISADTYIDLVSAAMIAPLWNIFIAVVGVWIVLEGYQYLSGQAKYQKTIKDLVFLIVAAGLLKGNQNGLISEMFSTSISIMASASSAVFDVIPNSLPDNNLSGISRLIFAVETSLQSILDMGWELALSWSLTTPFTIIYALILCAPYFIILIVYISQTTVSIFRIMLISAFSPFLTLTFGFDWGRQMTVAGLKTVLSSIMVLFASSLAVALIIFIASELQIQSSTVTEIREVGSLQNPEFILAVALGWAGSALMTEAVGIANSITGSALSNTATGVLTAGTTASAAAGGKAAHSAYTSGIDTLAKGAALGPKALIAEKTNELRKRFNDMNGGTPQK